MCHYRTIAKEIEAGGQTCLHSILFISVHSNSFAMCIDSHQRAACNKSTLKLAPISAIAAEVLTT